MNHIHSVIVSYNRPELTKQAVESYLATVSIPFSLIVVDNASDYETRSMLSEMAEDDERWEVLFLDKNMFPGYATNRGWEKMPPETTLLHRGDNDFAYLPKWCEAVLDRFRDAHVGQVGLRTNKEELGARWNVGGNNVIRRELWDKGLRYDERPWGEQYPVGWTEDSLFTPAVVRMGYEWVRVRRPSITSLSREDFNDPYYQETWAIRGITPPAKKET